MMGLQTAITTALAAQQPGISATDMNTIVASLRSKTTRRYKHSTKYCHGAYAPSHFWRPLQAKITPPTSSTMKPHTD